MDLTNQICYECNLRKPSRLKNLETDTFYTKNDENTILYDLEYFRAGGASVEVNDGRYCEDDEISIYVQHAWNDDSGKVKKSSIRTYYFLKDDPVEKCKAAICKEFGIEDPEQIKQLCLYQVDNNDDPSHPIKKEKAPFEKSRV